LLVTVESERAGVVADGGFRDVCRYGLLADELES
jgi:hypothetical protein